MPMTEGLYWQSDVCQERFYEENRMYCGSSLIIRLLLAGITGYFIWHSGQDKYVRAEMAGASEGVGIAGAEEPVPEETGGAGGVTNPDSVQGTDGPDAADGGLSDAPNGVKEQDPETGTEDKDPPLQFVFAGDILLSDHVLNAYQKAGNIGEWWTADSAR